MIKSKNLSVNISNKMSDLFSYSGNNGLYEDIEIGLKCYIFDCVNEKLYSCFKLETSNTIQIQIWKDLNE